MPNYIVRAFYGMIIVSMWISTANAADTSKSKFINLWTNACVANGKSTSLKLTFTEVNTIKMAYHSIAAFRDTTVSMGMKQPPLAQMVSENCGCMARYIARNKRNFQSPTADSVVNAAQDKCARSYH